MLYPCRRRQPNVRTAQAWSQALLAVTQLCQSFPNTLIRKQGCMELTGFTDSPWSGSSFTFPSKSLESKITILYLMLFRVLLLSQDLMKKHQISILNNHVPKPQLYLCTFQWGHIVRETKQVSKPLHFSEPWFPHLKWEYSHQSPSLNQDFMVMVTIPARLTPLTLKLL